MAIPEPLHVLVVGAGSVGRRHMRNFAALGHRVSVVDPQGDRRAQAASGVDIVAAYGALDEALASAADLDAVAVCSPTKHHAAQTLAAIERGLPVFVEKPLAMDSAEAGRIVEAVERTSTPLLLGYTYRWWPPLGDLRERLVAGEIGEARHVSCTMSAHLADWHPWERYQDFYMSSRAEGGGALLDESHVVDLVLWLFGPPAAVFGRVEQISSLEMDADDNVDALLVYERDLRVSIHLDLYGRPHDRSIVVRGERGTLEWTFDPNRLRHAGGSTREWTDEVYTCERNDMFVRAAEEFASVARGETPPSCTARDGARVLGVLDAIRQSSDEGRLVALGLGATPGVMR